jgi:hypothetical protein
MNFRIPSDCSGNCGTVLAQNAAKQASAMSGEEQKFLTQSLVEFQVTPSFAAPCQIVKNCPFE